MCDRFINTGVVGFGVASRPGGPRLVPIAAVLAAVAGTGSAGVNSWTNAAGGNWNNTGNWSLGSVPADPTVTAEISLAGVYAVTGDISASIGGLLLTNPDAVLDILNARALSVVSNTEATVDLVNNATIVVNSNSGSNFTQLQVGDPDTAGMVGAEAGRTGEVVLNVGPANGDLNDAILNIMGDGLHAANHTVRGKGRVNGLFTNDGVILADRIDDELRISGDVTQGAGGVVRATAGGLLGIGDSGIVSGGMLLTDTDGRIQFRSGTGTLMGGAHNMGDIDVLNVHAMRIDAGGITNDGTITVNSNQGANYTQAVVVADTAILGTGVLDLNVGDTNGDLSDATVTTDAVTATNGPDHAITGKGRLSGSWINDGKIRADRDGQELRISANVVQSATGSIRAIGNGVLGIGDGGRVSGGTAVTFTGGSIQATSGTGTIDGGLTNNGDMGVRNGQVLVIGTGGVVNHGTISVNSNQGTNGTHLRVDDNLTISGTGAVDLNLHDTNGDFNDALFFTNVGVTATLSANQSVTGKGRVSGAFQNNGTIDADRAGQDIRLTGTINQGPGGTIMGSGGGVAGLEGVAITGGFFDGVTGGAVLATGGTNTISGVTNLGEAGVRNGASMNILAGGFTNDGICTINSQPGISWTTLTVTETATIDGVGRIDLNLADDNGDFNDAQLNTAAGVVATNAAGHTIAGKGRVSGEWINLGTMTGDRLGRDLRLTGSYDQTGGGVIRGDNGGFASIFQADVTGGVFDSAGGGMVVVDAGPNSVSGVTNLGDAAIRNGASLDILAGGLTNEGTITINLQPGISWTILRVAEDATIDGDGVIDLNIDDGNGDYFDARINVNEGVTATHGVDHTISGKGRVTGAWINNGTISADRAGQDLQILNAEVAQSATGVIRGDDGGAIAFHNSTVTGGTFGSAGGGSVQFSGGTNTAGAVHNTGETGVRSGAYVNLLAGGMTNDGTFTVNSNAGTSWTRLTATADATIGGSGTLHLGMHPTNGDFNDCRLGAAEGFTLTIGADQIITGRGRLAGDVVLQGDLAPGSDTASSVDTIVVNQIGAAGSLTMSSTTEYRVEASAEEVNDRITASVPVVLAGTLRFTPIDGFDPPRPTRYTIVSGPDITGEFDTLIYEGVVPEGGVFRVVYTDTETIAAVTCKADIAPPIGILDLADVTVFSQLFLMGSPLVDLAEPFGVLDLADILAFVDEFLAGCG